jgi:hypothetical protein
MEDKCRCGKEIREGNEPCTIIEEGKKVVICSDCYFDQFDKEMEKHPISNPEFFVRH